MRQRVRPLTLDISGLLTHTAVSRLVRALLLLPLLVAVGCDSGATDDSFDVSAYLGTYAGTRTVTDEGRADIEDVTVTFTSEERAGTFVLELTPEFGPPERIGGTFTDDGADFQVMENGFRFGFTVDRDGDIAGTYDVFEEAGSITGTLTPSRFDLTFQPDDGESTRTAIRTTR